jgi:hypothetical protein
MMKLKWHDSPLVGVETQIKKFLYNVGNSKTAHAKNKETYIARWPLKLSFSVVTLLGGF